MLEWVATYGHYLIGMGISFGLPAKILFDHYGGEGKLMNISMKPIQKYIDFDTPHHTIIGETGSGKTYGVTKSLAKQKLGVFYYNTVFADLKDNAKEYIKVSSRDNIESMHEVLLKGVKLHYVPKEKLKDQQKELEKIIDAFFDLNRGKKKEFLIVIDEVHLFKKDAKEQLIRLSTAGRNANLKGVFLTQSPQQADNNLLRQSSKWTIFYVEQLIPWFKTYHMPGEEIEGVLEKASQYSYIEYQKKEIKGLYKV